MNRTELAQLIKTGILGVDVREEDVRTDIARARGFPFSAYAVDLSYLELARELLDDTKMLLTAAVSYPLGGMTLATKLDQIRFALRVRADEINATLNLSAIKSADYASVRAELEAMVDLAGGAIDVIVIPQFEILTSNEKLRTCETILEAGVRAIKTDGHGGLCRPEDILLVRRAFGREISIEASGGIRNTGQALELLDAGANFIHTSTAYAVLENADDAP
jgi:deoxyribose-phosphate aldolase